MSDFFAFKDSTEQEFDRLESAGILTKVNYIQYIGCFHSSHSKKNVKSRICIHYKVTSNPALDIEQYPLSIHPRIFLQH